MNKYIRFALLICAVMMACVPGVNPAFGHAAMDGHLAGFWLGIWHGLISPFMLIVALFVQGHTAIYEIHNSGGWYTWVSSSG